MKNLLANLDFEVKGSHLDQNFCFDDNDGQSNDIIPKRKEKKYTKNTI